MTANDSKYYLSYLNKLVDRYNNTYNRSINSAWTENIESNSKAPKLKVNDRVKITKYQNIFSKVNILNTLKIGQEKYLLLILF